MSKKLMRLALEDSQGNHLLADVWVEIRFLEAGNMLVVQIDQVNQQTTDKSDSPGNRTLEGRKTRLR